jgi:hypothetical protein
MAGTQKKVIVRPFEGPPVPGYLPAAGFGDGETIAFMDSNGRSIQLVINHIKLIAYVWDFNSDDIVDPERLGRKRFLARPRNEGLWVRMTFRDGDVLEGVAAADLGLLKGLVTDRGLIVLPPDGRSNTQRVYVPRMALSALEILGVIGKKKASVGSQKEPQPGLFGED